jgi:2'-5' RNA ligase
MPTGRVYYSLAKTIAQLSREHLVCKFEPHVTLLGGLSDSIEEISTRTYQLANSIQPYETRLGNTDYLDDFYKCLFIRVQPSRPVMEANLKARKIFVRNRDPKYMPHLSLMYGDFTPATKETIIARIGREFNLRFEVRAIYLYSTKGEPKDWYRIQEFKLSTGILNYGDISHSGHGS